MENEKRKRIVSSVICIVLSIALVIEFVTSAFQSFEEQFLIRMEETGEQINSGIARQMGSSLSLLCVLARGFENYDNFQCEEALHELTQVAEEADFSSMWLVRTSGHAVSSQGEVVNLTDTPYLKDGLNGNSGISGVITSELTNVNTVVLYSPMYRDSRIIGLILGIYELSELSEVVNTDCFGGNGSCDILVSNGDIVMMSENSKLTGHSSFFTYLSKTDIRRDNTVDTIRLNMEQGESGVVLYITDKKYHYTYYEPIGINDWYLLLSMPEAMVASGLRKSLLSALLMSMALLGMAVVMFLFYYREKSLIMRKLIETDSLTGIMTRGAIEDRINEELEHARSLEYAMLVMDIDNFKKVNDQYGHMVGDRVLKKMAGILRVEFKTELVGRLGGDEFGVLISLRERSEEDVREEVSEFVKKLRKINTIDGDKVDTSVSIGLAFSPSDGSNFNMLYRKADERMYTVKTSGKNGIA